MESPAALSVAQVGVGDPVPAVLLGVAGRTRGRGSPPSLLTNLLGAGRNRCDKHKGGLAVLISPHFYPAKIPICHSAAIMRFEKINWILLRPLSVAAR